MHLTSRNAVLVSILFAVAFSPTSAKTWWAWNRHQVHPVGGGAFEVIGRVGSGPRQYWCAAGDFARHVLGVGETDRIFIVQGRAPAATVANRTAVTFSMQPPPGELPPPSYSLSMDRVGDSLTAAFARQYCRDPDMIGPFRYPWY